MQSTIVKKFLEKNEITEEFYRETIEKSVQNGKLMNWPSKYKKKLCLYAYSYDLIESGKNYTEKEMNDVLKEFYAFDYVLFRRALVDYKFVDRANDGSCYRKIIE